MPIVSRNHIGKMTFCLMMALFMAITGWVSADVYKNPEVTNPAYIGEVRDQGEGPLAPNVFETLSLNFTLHVLEPGSYTLWVKMETGIDVTEIRELGALDPDTYPIDIDIDGSTIYNSGIDGPYTIDFHLFNGGILQSEKYTTAAYRADDFGPGRNQAEPTYFKEGNIIRLPTEMMVAVFNITKPEISFFYAVDAGESVMFHVQYTKLVGFQDNGDGILTEEDAITCEADLSRATWGFNGNVDEYSLEFNIRAAVTMLDTKENALGHLIMSLHYSSNAYQEVTEQKYDIDLEFMDPLENVDTIGLVHELYTDSGSHTLVSDHSTQPLQRVDFIGPDGVQGYYRWHPRADTYLLDGKTGTVDLNALDEVTDRGTKMTLTISYPYERSHERIFHDPVVGVNPENEPEDTIGLEVDNVEHDPVLFILAAIIASVLIFGTFISSKRKKR